MVLLTWQNYVSVETKSTDYKKAINFYNVKESKYSNI